MAIESIRMLDELSAALTRATKRREPAHTASLRVLDAIATAVTATRAYVQDELVLIDGSRGSAKLSELVKLWKQATREVESLEVSGDEKALLRSEGWQKPERWRKMEKQGGWLWMQNLLAHCEWLLTTLPPPPRK
jgi:hypothetical protein